MKKTMLVSLLTVCSLFFFGLTANARPLDRAARTASLERGFQGTPAELLAQAMPTMVERAGYEVRSADPGLSVALQLAFGGSNDFLWSQTLVLSHGSTDFSLTLPASLDDVRRGKVAIGMLENGKLRNAFSLQMTDGAGGVVYARLIAADGQSATDIELHGAKGTFTADRSDLLTLAKAMDPGDIQVDSGLFDPIIDLLEELLNILYMVKDVINIAICGVDEMIELLNDLNGCGWGSITPGGGAVVNLIICSIESTIEFVEELTSGCLGG